MHRLESGAEEITIQVGGHPILLRTKSRRLSQMLHEHYRDYVVLGAQPGSEFEVEVVAEGKITEQRSVRVRLHSGRWTIERGDLLAEWIPSAGAGRIRQSCNLYAIDTALRIINSLWLAQQGSFLVHAASAVRDGRAFLFVGVSGAGKTTISRLAPSDVTLLSDEISCVRRLPNGYFAHGTPFAGELGQPGANVVAPLVGIYLLAQATENSLLPVTLARAAAELLRNILLFSREQQLVSEVFHSACHLASVVPVYRLGFTPDHRVWELLH